jgi:hypothetical protein
MLESLKAANDSKSMTLSSPAMVTSSDLSYEPDPGGLTPIAMISIF